MSYNNSTYIGDQKTKWRSTYINSSPRYQKRKEKKNTYKMDKMNRTDF